MIGIGPGTRVMVATRPVDFRKGPDALAALVGAEYGGDPEQGFRAYLGIMRLVRGFGRERVEAACGRALDIGARTYGSVRSILDNRLDQIPAPRAARDDRAIAHPNIRGSRYYH